MRSRNAWSTGLPDNWPQRKQLAQFRCSISDSPADPHMHWDLERQDTFTHWHTEKIRYADEDAQAHVNNVAFAVFVETGFTSLCHAFDAVPGARNPGFAVADMAITFRRQASWPGELWIGSRIIGITADSLSIGTGLFLRDECIGTGRTELLWMRDGTREAMPPGMRARLAQALGSGA
jgi:acyl-CoA thioester hydrolase